VRNRVPARCLVKLQTPSHSGEVLSLHTFGPPLLGLFTLSEICTRCPAPSSGVCSHFFADDVRIVPQPPARRRKPKVSFSVNENAELRMFLLMGFHPRRLRGYGNTQEHANSASDLSRVTLWSATSRADINGYRAVISSRGVGQTTLRVTHQDTIQRWGDLRHGERVRASRRVPAIPPGAVVVLVLRGYGVGCRLGGP
jgi:hypothetical protein